MKVSGNLNTIQSSVNITDLRLGFHKKNPSIKGNVCDVA